jgi:hypothetical protein
MQTRKWNKSVAVQPLPAALVCRRTAEASMQFALNDWELYLAAKAKRARDRC